MLPSDEAGQADLLNSIVTITDLLSHDLSAQDTAHELETLGKLIEAIAGLKGLLIANEGALESFGDSGGFESLLRALKYATSASPSDDDDTSEREDDPNEEDAVNDQLQDESAQLRKELLQLTFAALSQILASSPSAKAFFARQKGYETLLTTILQSDILSHLSRRDYLF